MEYRILIVDDIFINRVLLKEVVKRFAIKCFESQNGKEAIEILQREDIDVILMDIEMPVMNGVETTRYIRENFDYPKKRTPIIALTAYNPDVFFSDYNDIGFNQLITKPYSMEGLKNTIDEVCGKKNT
ncbi:MAG: response regulator [Bacteroidales bacterium]|nr:MAG: response regulator [Bacteroidales bacterium]